jgi:hypothetical protein
MILRSNSSLTLKELQTQPVDTRRLNGVDRNLLVVSALNLEGNWQVVSRYGDSIWIFYGGTTNKKASFRAFNFALFPEAYRESMKAVIYRYLRRGRNDGRQPAIATLRTLFDNSVPFLKFLDARGKVSLEEAQSKACKAYSDTQKSLVLHQKKRPLKTASREKRLLAVEAIYELSQYCDTPMPEHPWIESSAYVLSGEYASNPSDSHDSATTPLIPDEAFTRLFQAASSILESAESILSIRDNINALAEKRLDLSESGLNYAKNRLLVDSGWLEGLDKFEEAVLDIRTACYIVVASLSGCRNHELAYLESNSYYSTKDDDNEVYWWMKSRSTKTGEGHTEWMVPPAAVAALRIADWWALPYQSSIKAELSRRRNKNSKDPELAEARKHQNAIFLGVARKKGNQVRTLSLEAWNVNLKDFARKHKIDWALATHQFRKKFANYAARSKFGDLRYLKEHFKHWAMDMTLGYALNEAQELELYAEIQAEYEDIKAELVETWLHPHEPLAGGYGEGIMVWRVGADIQLFRNRKDMVRAVSDSTPIRSNGHAWCTAQDDACVGNGGLESTRCANDCNNGVVGRRHADFYRGLYQHNKELLQMQDIGPGGLARAKRDLEICERTLRKLGYAVDEATV